MVAILRVKARWAGFTGAPGFTVLHFRDFGTGEGGGSDPDAAQAIAAADRTRLFFDTVKSKLPTGITVQIEPDVEMLEDTTGELVDSFSAGTQAVVSGTSTGQSFSSASGAVVNLRTNSIRNGRRIRGRIFLVPLGGSMYESGRLAASVVTDLQLAATALVDGAGTPDLGVFARPTGPGATDGQWVRATSANVPTLAAVLRSRRD